MIQISFNYNEDTNAVENIVVRNLTSNKTNNIPTVEVKENKLVISPKAISMIGCIVGERISINYYQENSEITFPVIGRSSVFADDDSGNKLTKSNTVSFKGFQKNVLLKYGSEFILEDFKDGIFKLVPKSSSFDIRKVF
jgi:hypothetical protein